MFGRIPAGLGLCVSLFALSVPMVHANDEGLDSMAFEEIVVTANRREQNLDKVPASISAFSKLKMDRQGVRDVRDIALLTPGLTFTQSSQFTGSNTNIAIRGIASGSGTGTTGIYIDDMPIQTRSINFSTSNTYPRVFDLERIEVLRGPQGTLFGAGAEGGAVRFITPKPSLQDYSVYSRTELSSTKGGEESYEGGIAVGGPIVEDKLGFRVSAWHQNNGGWIDHVDYTDNSVIDKNSNSEKITSFKASLMWQPSEHITITPSIFYQRQKNADTNAYWESLSDEENSDFRQGHVQLQPKLDKFLAPSLDVSIDLGAAELVSVTSYFKRDSLEDRDYTIFNAEIVGGPGTLPFLDGQRATSSLDDFQRIWTQEVRLQSTDDDARLRWVLGGYYSDDEQSATFQNEAPFYEEMVNVLFNINFADFGFTYLPGDLIYESFTDNDTKQKAVFGQLDFDLTEKLTATLGARYTDIKNSHRQTLDGWWGGGAFSVDEGETSEDSFTPKFGVSYQHDDDNLYYASVSKGFRPGSAQTRVPDAVCGADLLTLGLDESPNSYNSDSVWAYEVGSKNNLAGGRVKVDANAYLIKWSDIQTFLTLPSCSSGFVYNAGSVTSKGFDLSAQAYLTDNLSAAVAIGYTDAKFTETISVGTGANQAIAVEDGDTAMPGSDLTVTVTGQYDFTVMDRQSYVRFDYSYGSKEADLNPNVFGINLEETPAPATNMFNMRAGMQFENFEVALFANNITNAHPGLGRVQLFAGSPLITNVTFRPRTIGLTASYRY